MKNSFHTITSKPKVFISVTALIVCALSVWAYAHIGTAPVVPESLGTASKPAYVAGQNIALSFPKSGRIESVSVKTGDSVHAGQVLATLSAPDALGAVNQAKGALDLARAQLASLSAEYGTTKKQQDLLVDSAYSKLLSEGLEGVPDRQDANTPIITGTYSCGKEGAYTLKAYASGDPDSGYSVNFSGIESGMFGVKYDNAVPLGTCGLQIRFTHADTFSTLTTWTVSIPNTKSGAYLENKNAYDLAVTTREKVLADLSAKIGEGSDSSVAKASVDAAMGAYQQALGAYQNNVITAPANGVVTFVDSNLKAGQAVTQNRSVISISPN